MPSIAETICWVLVAAFGFFVYFVPALIAFKVRHDHFLLIYFLNFFTGWTLIGWLVAFFWSLQGLPHLRETLDLR